MKKFFCAITIVLALMLGVSGCSGGKFDMSFPITVITRESGSGTRSAFIELFSVESVNEKGEKVDNTVMTADVNDSTGIVLSNIASNKNAIAYVSLGAINDTVKALSIDGVSATVENVKNGTYKISRPFNIATKSDISAIASDFIAFILSKDGQATVEKAGYIAIENLSDYKTKGASGKIVVAGSSSVTPVMQKLKEAYLALNAGVTIDIQESDSTSGITATIEGIADIGMVSRELKESEIKKGLTSKKIAIDGIAVIVNPENTIDGLKKDQVKDIYTGKSTKWSDIAAQ
ncbi:MAG: substrate-binding domain-containing protein [Clostridia bacterium]